MYTYNVLLLCVCCCLCVFVWVVLFGVCNVCDWFVLLCLLALPCYVRCCVYVVCVFACVFVCACRGCCYVSSLCGGGVDRVWLSFDFVGEFVAWLLLFFCVCADVIVRFVCVFLFAVLLVSRYCLGWSFFCLYVLCLLFVWMCVVLLCVVVCCVCCMFGDCVLLCCLWLVVFVVCVVCLCVRFVFGMCVFAFRIRYACLLRCLLFAFYVGCVWSVPLFVCVCFVLGCRG